MQGVKHRLQALGFDLKTGQPSEMPQQMEGGAVFMGDIVSTDFYNRWMSLYDNVQSRSIKEVAEEAAYTWFNRFMAIRIMAKQDFIAPVLEYESEEVRVPVIVSEARQGRMPQMKEAVRNQLMELLDDDSKTNEQFALLIVAYCHENPIINNCFGAIADYTELLLPQNILSEGGFVDMINHTEFITDEQYASAELIGWLYQFYISDRKDEAFAKKGKYDADEIAPATQIFTPNWIVKYMAENTLGRIYIDNNPYCDLKDDLNYLVDVKPSAEPLKVDDLADMKVADLACGSGHILNECFDMLYKIYVEEGYSRRSAIQDIMTKNLLGIDLDTRAKQLATFALLMKACQKDQSFLDGKVMPRVYNMPRPYCEVVRNGHDNDNDDDNFSKEDEKAFICAMMKHFTMGGDNEMLDELAEAIMLIDHADTLGSIMKFDISDRTRNIINVRLEDYEQQDFLPEPIQQALPYIRIILALTDKYAAICMNPPYMGSGRFDSVLSKYVKDNYPRSKADLFSVFMDVATDRLMPNGKYGMINMHSWMFLSSFEELRSDLLDNYCIDSLLHLGPRTFDELSGEVVQNAAFVITNSREENCVSSSTEQLQHRDVSKIGTYFRLVDGKNCADKERMYLEALENHTENVYYSAVKQDYIRLLPGNPIGYWISNTLIEVFRETPQMDSFYDVKSGLSTGNNDIFVRHWHEINIKKMLRVYCPSISARKNYKWIPYSKGGGVQKWYGNNELVVNWENEGQAMRDYGFAVFRNEPFYFREGITWSGLSSKFVSYRYIPNGFVYDSNKGPMIFRKQESPNLEYTIGFLNTKVSNLITNLLNPTLSTQIGDIVKIPLKVNDDSIDLVTSIAKDNIDITRLDWDAHETSWDFKRNELLTMDFNVMLKNLYYEIEKEYKETGEDICIEPAAPKKESVEWCYDIYCGKWERMFMQLHENEEELNRQFIEIYGLQDELTPEVSLDEITILQQGEISIVDGQIKWHDDVVMKQLISYAVGCMMGRYSIDKDGLILANQGDGLKEFAELVPNSRFEVDDDGIIPLMTSDTDFADNATKRFKQWLSVTFGEDTLVENLNFIEGALGKSLDDYFVKDFWKDHKKMYQNRPIYWLFSSKKEAFQCLVYMHRMNPYTAERIRTKYLLPHIEWLMQQQSEMEANAANLTTAERKKLDNIRKQIEECREYHDRLHVIADQQIAFDLDDGVEVNYAKFGDVLQKLK